MREIRTPGSVEGSPIGRPFYPESEVNHLPTIAKEIARLLKQQVNLSQVEAPCNHMIGDIADKLKGELIDATSKPEIILEEFDEEQSSAVANVLTALDVYFNTSDSDELENSFKKLIKLLVIKK
ncbi:hypothetical protein [Oceanobacillus sp. J11TS1]|uniref:hypothetical protein n=1 Tax=Oceanobacillus sp. J11TS1 TaxID=2807191 RepID=UPI001BB3D01C|nr:hypothetical protein [Oceanobacillus sp. J11TS1]